MTYIFGESGFFGQTDFLSVMDFIWGNLSLAIGALLISIFVGWIWGAPRAVAELRRGRLFRGPLARGWSLAIRFLLPISIFIVLITQIGRASCRARAEDSCRVVSSYRQSVA